MPTNLQNLTDETRDELASLALKISGNKKTRKGFLGLVKEVAPDTPIPEIDEVNAVEAKLASEREAREKFEKEQRDRWFSEDLAKKKAEAKAKHGLDDAGMAKMEEMMKKGELPADYGWAAPLFKQQTEVSAPTNYGSGGHGPLDLERHAAGLEGLMEDTDNWASRTAHALIDDIQRKGKASAF
jgi:hypothetical protein